MLQIGNFYYINCMPIATSWLVSDFSVYSAELCWTSSYGRTTSYSYIISITVSAASLAAHWRPNSV